MKSSPLAAAISIAGIILAAAGLYFSAFLPYRKAQLFIEAERKVGSVRTVEEYMQNYDRAFNFYSPIGDEEIAKFLGGNILNIMSQGQSEEVSRALLAYIEPRLFKDDVRHLLLLGNMYETLWTNFKQEGDYRKAVEYFEKARSLGPNVPPPLYNLLAIYSAAGDKENAQRIGSIILANWPDDAATAELIKQ